MNPGDSFDPQPDLLPIQPPAPTAANLAALFEEMQQQTQDLRTLFNATFVALIVLALGVNLFIYKQMRMARDQLRDQRPQMQRAEAEFTRRDPEFRRFINALQQHTATHPDFSPVLFRYRGPLVQYFPATAVLAGKPDPGSTVPAPQPAPGPATK